MSPTSEVICIAAIVTSCNVRSVAQSHHQIQAESYMSYPSTKNQAFSVFEKEMSFLFSHLRPNESGVMCAAYGHEVY
jgi:hypothetical protein